MGCVVYFALFLKLVSSTVEISDYNIMCSVKKKLKSLVFAIQGWLLFLLTEYITDISSDHRRSTANVWRTQSPSFGQSPPWSTDRYTELESFIIHKEANILNQIKNNSKMSFYICSALSGQDTRKFNHSHHSTAMQTISLFCESVSLFLYLGHVVSESSIKNSLWWFL